MATSAEKQFAAFIDRILRLKEEQDEIGAQVRDVYLEMKGVGYDKTAAGALVTELRKRDKSGAKFEEANAMLELYRLSYENAKSSHTHAHARETSVQPPAEKKGDANAKSAERTAEYPDSVIDRRRLDGSQQAESQPPQKHQNAPAESAADTISVSNPDRQSSSSPIVDEPEAVVPPSPASGSPIQFVRKTAKDYRPQESVA